ncbi:MAG: hypothetical protein AAFO84_08725 [Cyanobacteria bacterium J06598_1]
MEVNLAEAEFCEALERRLDGLEGLAHVAKRIGQYTAKDKYYWKDVSVYNHACDRFSEEKGDSFLKEAAEKEPFFNL